jgi:hypothetical protein
MNQLSEFEKDLALRHAHREANERLAVIARSEVTREQARDMADAHSEGLHSKDPRQFCPDCEGRELSSYPLAARV